jgi:hypothetical protein
MTKKERRSVSVILSGAKNLFPQMPAKAVKQNCGKGFFTPQPPFRMTEKGTSSVAKIHAHLDRAAGPRLEPRHYRDGVGVVGPWRLRIVSAVDDDPSMEPRVAANHYFSLCFHYLSLESLDALRRARLSSRSEGVSARSAIKGHILAGISAGFGGDATRAFQRDPFPSNPAPHRMFREKRQRTFVANPANFVDVFRSAPGRAPLVLDRGRAR